MANLLINPDEFFRERAASPPNLQLPLLIILIGGVISGINAYLVTGLMARGMTEETVQYLLILQFSSFNFALIMVFVLWVLFSVVFYGISSFLKGEGRFKKLLEVIGFGYLPWLLGTIVTTAIFVAVSPTIQVPVIDIMDPQQAAETGRTIRGIFAENTYLMIGWVVGVLFIIWTAYLWVFGIQHSGKIELRFAVITVVLPVASYIFYSAFGIGLL